MSHSKIDTKQGHWILAKMGKKVLRPGGRELTEKLVAALHINREDTVVEIAPGLGFTANMVLKNNPKQYTGVELNKEAAGILKKKIKGEGREIIISNAADLSLESASRTKVYGEAMLTMQPDYRKSKIIGQASRVLKKGGLYGVHELGLTPNDLNPALKTEIQQALAKVIQVNVRPLTKSEWVALMEKEGFKVLTVETNPMHLLEPKRVIQDEGFFRTLKIIWNVLTHPKERARIFAMRKVFRKYQQYLNAVAIVVQKL